jgi:putative heme-binding domain-containing protein
VVADGRLVDSPVALAFDERQRLFVAERPNDSVGPAGGTGGGRIRLLEDTDGDGVFDTSVVFADRLDRPTAIACSRGGLFVVGPSDLNFLLDQDGDGIADLRRTLLTFRTRWGGEDPRGFPGTMTSGPDRRIYVTFPEEGVEVLNANAPGQPPLWLVGGGFSFDPLNLQLRAECGERVSGQAFDPVGRRLVTSGATLAVVPLDSASAQRNPFAPEPPWLAAVASLPDASARLECLVHPAEAQATNLVGEAILANPLTRAVYQMPLRPAGPPAIPALRASGGWTPWVTGGDDTFQPMQVVVGPLDALYIADFAQAPRLGGASTDNRPGSPGTKASGRIWRLVRMDAGVAKSAAPDFSAATSLAAGLGRSNAWARGTAARLLLERRSTNAIPELRTMLTRARWPVARIEALRALNAAGAATLRDLQQALGDRDASVRVAALGMVPERAIDGQLPAPLWDSLRTLADDPAAEIRLQVALALGGVRVPPPAALLTDLYLRDPSDPWMVRALLTVEPDTLASLFRELVRERRARESVTGPELLCQLAGAVGLGGRGGDVSDALGVLLDTDVPLEVALPIIAALAQGVEGRGLRLPEADEAGHWAAVANVAQTVLAGGGDARRRADAVRIVGACAGSGLIADEPLLLLFSPNLPGPMRIPMMQALANQGFERDFQALTQRWHLWDPPEQRATIDILLQSEPGANALLAALADRTIPAEALTSVHLHLLRGYPADSVRTRAARLLGSAPPDRDGLVSEFLAALDLPASAERGREWFGERCASCHAADARRVAPSREALQARSGLQLLAGLLDPSRELAAGYHTTVLRLPRGRIAWGVVREPHPDVIELGTAGESHRYRRGAVGLLEQPDWSLMPDNTVAGLTRQDVADLIQFIRSPK